MVEATLSGFSSFLDWRPLTFEKPVPRVWTCDICGLMSKETVVLECVHVFCSDCYQRLLYKESPVCPLDATYVNSTKRFVLGDSQKKQLVVQCLNTKHGCTFKGPLGDLEAHFTKDCDSHVVTCKRCGSSVLRTKLLEHLEESCKEYVKGVELDLIQKPTPGQDSDSSVDHDWRFKGVLDDLVKFRVEENFNLLPDSIMQCTTEDLAEKLVESWQHCVKDSDDFKKISNLIEPMEHYAQDVTDIKQELTDLKVAVEQLNNPAHAAPCKSDEKGAVRWRALGFYCSGISAQNHIFVCINVQAKLQRAPKHKAPPDIYAALCPCSNGKVSVRGYEVQVHQLVYRDYSLQPTVGFRLTFLGESQNSDYAVDMSLVLVHPTNADLDKSRPLKRDELFRTQSELTIFSFYYTHLCNDGFVADDMLLLCLKV